MWRRGWRVPVVKAHVRVWDVKIRGSSSQDGQSDIGVLGHDYVLSDRFLNDGKKIGRVTAFGPAGIGD